MPTYDYVCAACGSAVEIFQPMSEAPKKKCPRCGKPKLERRIGAGAGFLFKGGGFHRTDYRSSSYKAGEKAEASGAASTTDASGKTESAKPDGDKAGGAKAESSKPEGKNSESAKHDAHGSPAKSDSKKKKKAD
jgi:putative FmdB family regulatory protein